VHDQRVPPSHQYIAFYLYLQEVYRAHAVVHFGTHGTLELLPRRAAGMGPDDFADALLGRMPNINPWILDNLGEATLARRRAYAVLIDHLTPPFEPVKAAAPLRALHEDVEKAMQMEPGPVREAMAGKILAAMRKLGFALDAIRGKEGKEISTLDAEAMKEIDIRLHSLEEERVPRSLHLLGQAPEGPRRQEMLSGILGRSFATKVGGAAAVGALLRCVSGEKRPAEECLPAGGARPEAERKELLESLRSAARADAALDKTPDEIGHTLDALDGKYVLPGPGNDPTRNPAALPTGRNMYALDPEQVPSDAAMIVARKLAADMIEAHKKKHDGVMPRKIAINLNGFETMRDTGVTEGQALALVGVEPVRDERGVVSDVKLIPSEKLGRPRVDVMLAIGGAYRDNFASRVRLLDRAIKMAQASPEAGNVMAENTREAEKKLEAGGMSHDEAARSARLRIFGTAPGQYNTQLLYLLPKSGEWKDRKELADVYRQNMRFAYGEDIWGAQSDAPYAAAMAGTDAVSHVWSSTMMSPLTNHHVYEYLGGLSMAVETATGKKPDALIADTREPDRSRIRDLDEVVSTESSARLLNEGWIKEMEKSGYAGAGHVAAYTENLFGWATSVPGSVDPEVFARVKKIYLDDEGKLGARAWLSQSSPEALLSVTTTLIESSRLGYWKPSDEDKQKLVADYMEQVTKGGPPTGMMGGNNQKLEAYVQQTYAAPGAAIPQATVAAYQARVKAAHAAAEAASRALGAAQAKGAAGAPAAGAPQVEGFAMRKTDPRPEAAPQAIGEGSPGLWAAGSALGIVALAFGAGLARTRPRRRGEARPRR
jgi:cobaltochelatase CobN